MSEEAGAMLGKFNEKVNKGFSFQGTRLFTSESAAAKHAASLSGAKGITHVFTTKVGDMWQVIHRRETPTMMQAESMKKAKEDMFPSTDDRKAGARRALAQFMENEARVDDHYGNKGERKHERHRVRQEWRKIKRDQKHGADSKGLWGGHLGRMQRMAESISDPGKCLRRARHLESEGLGQAAKFFYTRAQSLGAKIDNTRKELDDFNEWVVKFRGGHQFVQRRDIPGGGHKYVFQEPKPGVKATPSPVEEELGRYAKPGKGAREILSPHHTRSYGELRKLVDSNVGVRKAKYVVKAAAPKTAKPKWHELNTHIGQAEGQAMAYAARGFGHKKKDGHGTTQQDRHFWLAMSALHHDVADHLSTLRDREAGE